MRDLLSRLGNPQKKLKAIHIAGTKGKGSTAVMAASILSAAGCRTGLYTSPHLISFRERIQIDGKMIPETDLAVLTAEVRPAAEAVAASRFGAPTFFEVYTALAFRYFARQKTDRVVIEVGLGGRLDATNVIEPLACGLTPISLDHTRELGRTIAAIAAEKAGIIKPGVPVFSAAQPPAAGRVIAAACRKKKAPLTRVVPGSGFTFIGCGRQGTVFRLPGGRMFTTPLLGRHQAANAALAVALARQVRPGLSDRAIQPGLDRVRWPGRVQVIRSRPLVIVDGAHNAASARALLDALRDVFRYRRLIVVAGMAGNKDIAAFGKIIRPAADRIFLTRAGGNPRSADPVRIKKIWGGGRMTSVEPEPLRAFKKALAGASPDDLVCVTGSFYLVGALARARC
jgi:dihydrofolate synthase/folylpolyglutamate synthase